MPKSKRNKVVNLTKTDKKGRQGKETLFQKVRDAMDEYNNVYVLKIENNRNTFIKQVRNEFKTSKFFFGSNRVMQKALGLKPEEEYYPGIKDIAEQLNGEVGLLFTNVDKQELEQFFEEYVEKDFARGGNVATETVEIKKGPLELNGLPLPNNMEPQLRKLGLPTELQKGVLVCRQDHVICQQGQVLTPEQAHLLKHFGHQLAEFKIKMTHWFSKTAGFNEL